MDIIIENTHLRLTVGSDCIVKSLIRKESGEEIRAFFFERNNRSYVVFWHTTGCGKLKLSLPAEQVCFEKELGGEAIPFETDCGCITVPVAGRCYLSSALSKETLLNAFQNAELA